MQVTIRDGAVFVYTLGVLLSGMWLVGGRPEFTPRIVVLGAVITVFWTAYFKWKVTPQFLPDDEEDDEENEARSQSAQTSPEE